MFLICINRDTILRSTLELPYSVSRESSSTPRWYEFYYHLKYRHFTQLLKIDSGSVQFQAENGGSIRNLLLINNNTNSSSSNNHDTFSRIFPLNIRLLFILHAVCGWRLQNLIAAKLYNDNNNSNNIIDTS